MGSTPLRGIHIAEMETAESLLKHAVVIDGDRIIHDPMPYPNKKEYTCCGIYFFVPLNPKLCRALV